MKRHTYMEVAVGIFVLLGLAVAMVMVLSIANRQNIFVKRHMIYAVFEDVGGLKTGAPVFLSGVDAGTVDAIVFTPEGKVKVALQVQETYIDRIKDDSVATIGSIGLLGDKSIEISVGTPAGQPVSPGDVLRTEPPLSFNEIVESIGPVRERLEEVLTNLGAVTEQLAEDREALSGGINNASDILGRMSRGEGTLGRLLKDDQLYQNLVQATGQSRETLTAIEDLVARAGPMIDDIRQTAVNVRNSSDRFPEIAESAERLMQSAQDASERLAALTEDIHSVTDDLPEIMTDVSEAASNVREATEELPPAARSLRSGVEEGGRVIEAAKGNWLLKGSFPDAEEPAAREGDRR